MSPPIQIIMPIIYTREKASVNQKQKRFQVRIQKK